MDKNRHLISKYLGGELDPESAFRFEETLMSDEELREELRLYERVDEAVADTELLNLRAQLNAMHDPVMQEFDRRSAKTYKRVMRYAATAASVAVILGFSIFLLLRDGSITGRFYSPYDISMVTRSADMNIDQTLREAMLKYENHQYREAVILFERVITAEPEMLSNFLYSGISYFEIKEYKRAENSLQKVIDHNDNLYIEQAEWYIGFCYLMTDRKEKAYKQFRKIADEKGYYSKNAKRIIKRLK